jgi:hypothetical protein
VDRWLHWEDATHGFDLAFPSAFRRSVDGTCQTMVNGFGTHQFCYNEKRAKQMLDEIRIFSSMSAQ